MEKSEHEKEIDTLAQIIISSCVRLFKKDPDRKAPFLKKLSKRLFEFSLEQAGRDPKKLKVLLKALLRWSMRVYDTILEVGGESEFISKQENRLWKLRLKHAGKDRKARVKLMSRSFARARKIEKELEAEEKEYKRRKGGTLFDF